MKITKNDYLITDIVDEFVDEHLTQIAIVPEAYDKSCSKYWLCFYVSNTNLSDKCVFEVEYNEYPELNFEYQSIEENMSKIKNYLKERLESYYE